MTFTLESPPQKIGHLIPIFFLYLGFSPRHSLVLDLFQDTLQTRVGLVISLHNHKKVGRMLENCKHIFENSKYLYISLKNMLKKILLMTRISIFLFSLQERASFTINVLPSKTNKQKIK